MPVKIISTTPRLLIRELEFEDENDLFEMDSDPEVHALIENQPAKTLDEIRLAIEMIRKQYRENGVARWVVADKQSGEFLGLCGLKFFKEDLNGKRDFYELGYRFKRRHWGKGYATESANFAIRYGFDVLHTDLIVAITDPAHLASKNVLGKLGFEYKESFFDRSLYTDWFELRREIWEVKKNAKY